MQHEEIGQRIKRRRESLNLSASDLAKRLSLSKATIHRYESGEIKNIKIPVIMAIAKELQVTAAWLLGKSSEMETPEGAELEERYRDVSRLIADTKVYLTIRNDLTMFGKTITDGDRRTIITILDLLLKLAEERYK